jgi:hypothetical protein
MNQIFLWMRFWFRCVDADSLSSRDEVPTSTPVPVLINGFLVGTERTVYGSNAWGVISEGEDAEEDFIRR